MRIIEVVAVDGIYSDLSYARNRNPTVKGSFMCLDGQRSPYI
jgi:hypothetical protein